MSKECDQSHRIEPRWPAGLGILAVGLSYLGLPANLTVGPQWLPLLLLACLLAPTVWASYTCRIRASNALGHLIGAVTTLYLVTSVALLVHSLPLHLEPPTVLLRSAALLWVTNILVFASWYWRLDAGGPHAREIRDAHTDGAFLFPQMALDPALKKEIAPNWSPGFVDYLFLAFNTSTALSPADTSALSRWAKLLMMVQAAVSLSIIVLIAARAVNIL